MAFDLDRLIGAIEHIGNVRRKQKRHPGASCANWEFDDEIRRISANTMAVYGKDFLAALKELKRLKDKRGGTDGP